LIERIVSVAASIGRFCRNGFPSISAVTPPKTTQPDVNAQALTWHGVLDADALARMQVLDPTGSAGLVPRVLGLYVQSLQRLLGQLCAARQAADVLGQHRVVHTLKSSSASVGALRLAEQCADIERRLRDGVHDGLAAQLDAMAAEGERVLAALRRV
jgi:HPt (histidine-containing phosphotransfer) domain-containing protein